MKSMAAFGLSVMLMAGLIVSPAVSQVSDKHPTVDAVRDALLRLPYYGVFDFLAFTYENGVVSLAGYDSRGNLKADAERAVKRVDGVKEVRNQIEVLPASQNDEDLRWRVFYAIYSDPFLSRYAPGLGAAWGHRHAPRASMWRPSGRGGVFPGMQPFGNYPISIIVKGGRITLHGLVDSDSDKTMAYMRARGVSGSFGVDNQLVVEGSERGTEGAGR